MKTLITPEEEKARNRTIYVWAGVLGSILLVGILLWVGMIILWAVVMRTSPVSSGLSAKNREEVTATKAKMCDTVQRLIESGAFTKVQHTSEDVTHAYVDHSFYALTIDQKKTALGAVAACYIDLEKQDQLGLVIINDGYSGKQIGTYSMAQRLELDR